MTKPEPESARLALARARAAGVTPRHGHGVPDHLAGAAARTGRRLVEVIHTGVPMLALGWLDGHEPSTDPVSGITLRTAPPVDLVVFAACLGNCWLDAHAHPWPGEPCDEGLVVETVAEARGNHGRSALGGYRMSLRHLAEAHWIEMVDGTVRLGPKTAVLTTAQVDVLRVVHERLPRPDSSVSSAQNTGPMQEKASGGKEQV